MSRGMVTSHETFFEQMNLLTQYAQNIIFKMLRQIMINFVDHSSSLKLQNNKLLQSYLK